MKKYVSTLKNKILRDIQEIEKKGYTTLQTSKLIIPILENAFEELKLFINNYSFKDKSEEIKFFKETKPRLFSLLVYHSKVYNIEMRMPTGSVEDRKAYLQRVQNRIKYFFDMNLDFYQYYRSGNTHLDYIYFLRGKPDIHLLLDSYHFEKDSSFSTCYDFKVTKILANEMLAAYVDSKLAELDKCPNSMENYLILPKIRITWTGKKAELVEQIYAWIEAASFNNGNVTIKDLVDYIEIVFNIDLGDYYHIFIEIRERKGDSRTTYLDKLIKLLNDRMNQADKK
ncbi:RteC domain-containing protein [Dysgonomonas sp. Marseille-P4677]|uniref:RteC domain-containing protein n=1 Tax=Dysgonomonas sp. Marseille-P4677 TaxID=2364790 RepID=UPI001911C20F|nr:RteC domain-containing protein [Dysgonomonas sp. Marseille-P4677]MBK5719534.1 RteC domain-containing protein [Dysgonomonas sp. Marseille-P4677]